MIGQLHGIILVKLPPQLLLEVNGVGYEIEASMNTFYHLPEVGARVILHTHFVVREDAQLLYGFHSLEERALFRSLLKVNGVGPKLAITILSSTSPQEFIQSVMQKDTDTLVRLPGVGKKTAERLIIEMRDKVANLPVSDTLVANSVASSSHASNDAVSALIALGYKPQAASRVVSKVDSGTMTSEEIIRLSLREIVV